MINDYVIEFGTDVRSKSRLTPGQRTRKAVVADSIRVNDITPDNKHRPKTTIEATCHPFHKSKVAVFPPISQNQACFLK